MKTQILLIAHIVIFSLCFGLGAQAQPPQANKKIYGMFSIHDVDNFGGTGRSLRNTLYPQMAQHIHEELAPFGEIRVVYDASPLELQMALSSPETRAVFWVSHVGSADSDLGDLNTQIIDADFNVVDNMFKGINSQVEFLGLIGCKGERIARSFADQGVFNSPTRLIRSAKITSFLGLPLITQFNRSSLQILNSLFRRQLIIDSHPESIDALPHLQKSVHWARQYFLKPLSPATCIKRPGIWLKVERFASEGSGSTLLSGFWIEHNQVPIKSVYPSGSLHQQQLFFVPVEDVQDFLKPYKLVVKFLQKDVPATQLEGIRITSLNGELEWRPQQVFGRVIGKERILMQLQNTEDEASVIQKASELLELRDDCETSPPIY